MICDITNGLAANSAAAHCKDKQNVNTWLTYFGVECITGRHFALSIGSYKMKKAAFRANLMLR